MSSTRCRVFGGSPRGTTIHQPTQLLHGRQPLHRIPLGVADADVTGRPLGNCEPQRLRKLKHSWDGDHILHYFAGSSVSILNGHVWTLNQYAQLHRSGDTREAPHGNHRNPPTPGSLEAQLQQIVEHCWAVGDHLRKGQRWPQPFENAPVAGALPWDSPR